MIRADQEGVADVLENPAASISEYKGLLFSAYLDPNGGGYKSLRKVGNYLRIDKTSCFRWFHSSAPLWEPQISQGLVALHFSTSEFSYLITVWQNVSREERTDLFTAP